MPVYTLTSAVPADQFTTQHGTFQVYSVQFAEYNGHVQLNQKVTSPAPVPGTKMEGDITRDSRGNPKFKKTFNPQGPTGGAGPYSPTAPRQQKDNGEGMAWGNSLTNAVALTVKFSKAKTVEEATEEALATANALFLSRPGVEKPPVATEFSDGTPIPEPKGEEALADIPDGMIDLDAIPF